MSWVYAVALPHAREHALAVPMLRFLPLVTDRAPREVVDALERVWSSREVDRTVAVTARLVEDTSLRIVAIGDDRLLLLLKDADVRIRVCWLEVEKKPRIETIPAETLREALLKLSGEEAIKLSKPTAVSSYVKQDTSFPLAFYVSNSKIMYIDTLLARHSRKNIYQDKVRYVIKAGIAAILIG